MKTSIGNGEWGWGEGWFIELRRVAHGKTIRERVRVGRGQLVPVRLDEMRIFVVMWEGVVPGTKGYSTEQEQYYHYSNLATTSLCPNASHRCV